MKLCVHSFDLCLSLSLSFSLFFHITKENYENQTNKKTKTESQLEKERMRDGAFIQWDYDKSEINKTAIITWYE